MALYPREIELSITTAVTSSNCTDTFGVSEAIHHRSEPSLLKNSSPRNRGSLDQVQENKMGGHVACKVLVGKPEGKILGRPGCT
jgi:hypothetical protein